MVGSECEHEAILISPHQSVKLFVLAVSHFMSEANCNSADRADLRIQSLVRASAMLTSELNQASEKFAQCDNAGNL
jgi:hypothetical protein